MIGSPSSSYSISFSSSSFSPSFIPSIQDIYMHPLSFVNITFSIFKVLKHKYKSLSRLITVGSLNLTFRIKKYSQHTASFIFNSSISSHINETYCFLIFHQYHLFLEQYLLYEHKTLLLIYHTIYGNSAKVKTTLSPY